VELLVQRKYEALEKLSLGVRLTAEQIAIAVEEYGKTLILPPTNSYDTADVISIENVVIPEYSVRFRLFTLEEGQSDLEIQLTMIDQPTQNFPMRIELDNILVA
jgi:hypothetical protein